MKKILFSLVLVVFLSSGCAVFQPTTTLSPKAQVLVLENTYLSQLDDTQRMSEMASLSPAQREIVQQKKALLLKLKPLLVLLGDYTTAGQTPPAELQSQVNDLINQLVSLGGK